MSNIQQVLKEQEEKFEKEFHYKGEGQWFHTVNVCADPDDVDKITGTTDTAWAVPDSFKMFNHETSQTLLKAVLEMIGKYGVPAISGKITDSDECCNCGEDLALELYEAFSTGYQMAVDDLSADITNLLEK